MRLQDIDEKKDINSQAIRSTQIKKMEFLAYNDIS